MPKTYTVLQGDSLSLISQKIFGDYSMVDAIARMNNIGNKDVIYPGKVLELPIGDAKEVINSWLTLDRVAIVAGVVLASVSTWLAYKTYQSSANKKKALAIKK